MTRFEVTSSGPDRVRVAWEGEGADLYFIAKVNGDEVVEVTGGLRPFPTVFRIARGAGRIYRDRITYHHAKEFQAIVDAAAKAIAAGQLATKAMERRRDEQAAHDRAVVVDKAAAIRRLLRERQLPAFTDISDVMLADLYDAIQNVGI